ncbi:MULTISPECIES: tripartite tricarboxylate transporter substrate-binding protein [Polaromonas]|uniref:Tripartite tricarboxylate transporter substrate-binding protein n=1 Tax=Polaromonas aquatica TaxID=332657 RepID=A0ABW1U4Y4_9BURK
MQNRRFLSLALLPMALALAGLAQAQVPKDRGAVKLVVGFPAGGSADVLARIMADKLKEELGVPVVVDNRAGAGGQIAADYVKGQPGDGLTILLGTSHMMVMAPLTVKSIRYQAARDFKPVARIASFYESIAVPASSPGNTLAQWLEAARKDQKHASYGVPAPGSLPQFIGYQLGTVSKTALLAVPYKGSAPLAQDLVGGQLAAGVLPIADMVQYHGTRVKILAVNGTRRADQLPNVPTLKELGYPQFDDLEWTGFFVPASTSRATVQQLQAVTAKVVALKEVREALQKMGTEADFASAEVLEKRIADDVAMWGPVVKASGFSSD